jgi:exopolyphosphatase/pppGpp-phosphohydrolase
MRNAPLSAGHAIWLLVPFLMCPAPARAALHGGVEIGAKGVKATVIDARPGPHGLSVKPLFAGTYNATLSEGIAANGKFDPRALQATAAAVKKYVEEIEGKHKVPKENIYVVGSSGIFSPIEKDREAVKARQAELARAIKDATGRTMDFISPRREAELSIVGIVPRKLQDVSLLIDIGSGNTKGGYRDATKKFITFAVPFGSVTFTKAAEKRSASDPVKGGASVAEENLRPLLRSAVKEHPALTGRERVYLSGGACWALANFVKPADRSGYAALTGKDIDTYHKMLASKPGEYPVVDLSALSEKDRAAAEKDIARIKKTFTPAQLLAGAEILKALSSEFKLQGEKKLYFARNGYLGWILAYAALKTKGS